MGSGVKNTQNFDHVVYKWPQGGRLNVVVLEIVDLYGNVRNVFKFRDSSYNSNVRVQLRGKAGTINIDLFLSSLFINNKEHFFGNTQSPLIRRTEFSMEKNRNKKCSIW